MAVAAAMIVGLVLGAGLFRWGMAAGVRMHERGMDKQRYGVSL